MATFDSFISSARSADVPVATAAAIAGDWLSEQDVPYAWLLSCRQFECKCSSNSLFIELSNAAASVAGNDQYLTVIHKPDRPRITNSQLTAYAGSGGYQKFSQEETVFSIHAFGRHLVTFGSLNTSQPFSSRVNTLRSHDLQAMTPAARRSVFGVLGVQAGESLMARRHTAVDRYDPATLELLGTADVGGSFVLAAHQPAAGLDVLAVGTSGEHQVIDLVDGMILRRSNCLAISADRRHCLLDASDGTRSDRSELLLLSPDGATTIKLNEAVHDARLTADGRVLLAGIAPNYYRYSVWNRRGCLASAIGSHLFASPPRIVGWLRDGNLALCEEYGGLAAVDFTSGQVTRLLSRFPVQQLIVLYAGPPLVVAYLSTENRVFVEFIDV